MAYTKTIWENSPSENTPLSAENLNNIENGIDDVDTRLTTAESDINNVDTRLTTAEGEIDTAQTDINNAESVIGNETDTYSASSTYALGSLVIYNSLLYKCTTAITVAEAWTIGHWTQVSLTSEVNDMKAKILWTNPTPTGTFPSQVLNIDMSLYDSLEFVFYLESGAIWARALKSLKIPKIIGAKYVMDGFIVESITASVFSVRAFTITSENSISFEQGYNNVTNSSATIRDYACVPLYIIGHKTGLFS